MSNTTMLRAPLAQALMESRERWRDLVCLAADLAFETDAQGRLVFLSPADVLGWRAADLLGTDASALLAALDGQRSFDPFRPAVPVRQRRAWLRRADGGCVCLAFAAAPLLDAAGHIVGARGFGYETTVQDQQDASVAGALRRGEVVDHVLWQMRQEVLAPRMMATGLEALLQAMGAEGTAVIEATDGEPDATVLHLEGIEAPGVIAAARRLMLQAGMEPVTALAPDGRPVLVCPSAGRLGTSPGLALWRAPGVRPWDAEDRMVAGAATGVIRVVLEHEAIQREMTRQARTDGLTGLLNRTAFLEEVVRRVDRLDREQLPGTLMFVDLDHFKRLNDCWGHEVGDAALVRTAALLRTTFRPSDLVARLGGDEFAVWMDGADDLTAAERAEALRLGGPSEFASLAPNSDLRVTMSIGIASRAVDGGEDVESLMRRADMAMYAVKRGGRGQWRVSHDGPM